MFDIFVLMGCFNCCSLPYTVFVFSLGFQNLFFQKDFKKIFFKKDFIKNFEGLK